MQAQIGSEMFESVVVDDDPDLVEESLVQVTVDTEEPDDSFETDKASEKTEKLCKFPLTRIKSLIKLDRDVTMASQDAVFIIAKAAELFVDTLAKEAYKFTKQNKKKTIQRKDVDDCIDTTDALAFLEGTLD